MPLSCCNINSTIDSGRQFLIEGDAKGYWILGEQLANGKPFELYDPPRRVMRTPGFPWVLSIGMRMFGSDIVHVRLLFAVVGTAACGLVFWLGRELADPATGVIAAGIAAVSPAFVGFTPLILSETLFAATMLLSLIADRQTLETTDHAATIHLGIVGGCFGGRRYARASELVVGRPRLRIPVLGRRAARPARFVSGGYDVPWFDVGIAPWTIRNYRVTGHIGFPPRCGSVRVCMTA